MTQGASAKTPREFCESALSATKSATKNFILKRRENWRTFRLEVKEQGPIRYILAPRAEPEKFHKILAFLDPVFDLPVETYSWFKFKLFHKPPVQKRLSAFITLPASILVWTWGFNYLDEATLAQNVQTFETSISEDAFGARYVSEWVLSGGIDPQTGAQILSTSRDLWNQKLLPLSLRIDEFQTEGLWNKTQADLGQQVLDQLMKEHTPKELFQNTNLLELIVKTTSYQALFESLPPTDRFTLLLWPNPSITYEEHPDSYWLGKFFDPNQRGDLSAPQKRGLEALLRLYHLDQKQLSIVAVTELVAQTLSHPDVVLKKQERWQKMKVSDVDFDFLYRTDLPLFSKPIVFSDLSHDLTLSDELDRWKLLLTDSRFHNFKVAWESGQISDFTALLQVELHIQTLSQIHKMSQSDGGKLTPAESCQLIYGSKDQPENAIFAGLSKLDSKLPQTFERSKADALRFELAQLYFESFVKVSAHPEDEALSATVFKEAFAQERQWMNDALKTGTWKLGKAPVSIDPLTCLPN